MSATFASLSFVGFKAASGQKALSSRCDYRGKRCSNAMQRRSEANLRKTRRIEITAFRRTTTLYAGEPDETADEPDAGLTERLPETQNRGPNSADDCSAQGKQIDLAQTILSAADSVSSPELTRLIAALVIRKWRRPEKALLRTPDPHLFDQEPDDRLRESDYRRRKWIQGSTD